MFLKRHIGRFENRLDNENIGLFQSRLDIFDVLKLDWTMDWIGHIRRFETGLDILDVLKLEWTYWTF